MFKLPNEKINRIISSDEDEAWYYWQDQGNFWESTPGVKEFLREFTD